MGDGESREGQVWEAMDLIADCGMTHVVAIFSCNGQGQADYVSKQQSPEMLAAKAEAFGWQAKTIDGHDPDAIRAALADPATRTRPLAVIAKTEKGWGCDSLKDKSNHGKPVPADRLDAALAELDRTYETQGICGTTVSANDGLQFGDNDGLPCGDNDGLPFGGVKADAPAKTSPAKPAPADAIEGAVPPHVDFRSAIENAGLSSALEKGKLATRRAYGAALLAIGSADERIIALDGDVRNSTLSEIFAKRHPDRFIECKIAEQNMVSFAVGLAASGFIPFVSTFAKFASRAYDQIEIAQLTRANIKITGSHAGISLAADGPSQMGLHDVAYFRSASEIDNGRGRPVCVSFHPCDAVAAYHCTWLMAERDGMCYLRTHRPDMPLIYPPETRFEIGGSQVLHTGEALVIVTAGYMVHVCMEAARMLADDGIHCTLIDAYSFPLNAEPVLAAASKTSGRILCVEDNYLGGLGGAVAEAAAAVGGATVQSMTCRKIPKSAKTPAKMMAYMGLSPTDVVAKVRGILG
jgi:transketolase